MANYVPPVKSLSGNSSRAGPLMFLDQRTPAQYPPGSPARSREPQLQGPQELNTGIPGADNSLLPCETGRGSLADDLRNDNYTSSSSDVETGHHSVALRKSGYIIWMVLIYAILALTAWILICLLTFKPLTTEYYGFDTRQRGLYKIRGVDGWFAWIQEPHTQYVKSEEIYRIARTMQAVVSVLTIPLTSSVCSAAAVIFTQLGSRDRKLTMRQMMTLADKGWTEVSPATITRLLLGRGKQLSSSLLLWALLLNLFGAIITPLQTILRTQETIKTPTVREYLISTSSLLRVVDIADKFESMTSDDASLVTTAIRDALKSTSNSTLQPRLWQDNIGCVSMNGSRTEQCELGTATFSNFSTLSGPYLAQVPVGYHTGLIKQFVPRINSTVTWEPLERAGMPADCSGEKPNMFYVQHANSSRQADTDGFTNGGTRDWSIRACMPNTETRSTWNDTYSRQDFTEVLYLDISIFGYERPGEPIQAAFKGGVFKITAETTAGYFELPNYMNGGQAGPLIDGEPDDLKHCGFDCEGQRGPHHLRWPKDEPSVSASFQAHNTTNPSSLVNNGPLLTVAAALFGNEFWANYTPACVDRKPLSSLLIGPGEPKSYDCSLDASKTPDQEEMQMEVVDYLQSFYLFSFSDEDQLQARLERHPDPQLSQNAFASAVFLANEAWLTSNATQGRREVFSDPGADMVIPAISRSGMVIISTLWVVFIACLLSLALYSARTPRWTHRLDAFALLRIGAAAHEDINFDIGLEAQTVEFLDELSGSIGDATGGMGDIGALGMGAATPLRSARRYKCYKGDEETALRG